MLRLKEVRERLGLSQTEVAKKLGITRQAYNHYEHGKRDPDTAMLQQIADLYNVSTDYLLSKNATELEAKIKNVAEEDPNLRELFDLYKKLSYKYKSRLLGAGYAMLAEQNKGDGLTFGSMKRSDSVDSK